MDTNFVDYGNNLPLSLIAVDGIPARSKHYWKSMRIGDAGTSTPIMQPQELLEWVGDDIEAIQGFYTKLEDRHLDALAANFAYAPYANAMENQVPDLARRIRDRSALLGATDFIAANANSTAETVLQKVSTLAPAPKEILADASRQKEVEVQLAQRHGWIPVPHLNDVHAVIATALERPDAELRRQQADDSRAAAEQALRSQETGGPLIREGRVQAVADFIAANRGLLSWKVRENIAEANPELRGVLADADVMRELDADINTKLSGISPLFVAEIQSIVASTLNRPDADNREQTVTQLRAALDQLRDQPGPTIRFESPSEVSESAGADLVDGQSMPPPSGADEEAYGERDEEATPEADHFKEAEVVNGFKPGRPDRARPAEPIGNLLEELTYETRGDGSVLYLLRNKPVFVDFGDHLRMAAGASGEERAILAALLLAMEKYAGNFELTGDDAFQRRAIDVMVKFDVKAQLRNPAQAAKLREAIEILQRPERTFEAGTPERPVPHMSPQQFVPPALPEESQGLPADAPVLNTESPAPPTHTCASGQPPVAPPGAESTAPTKPRLFTAGKMISHGKARFEHNDNNNMSYFVILENQNGERCTTWGVDLQRALAMSDARIGDQVILQNLGKRPVDVQRMIHDADGKPIGSEWIPAVRVHWEVEKQGPFIAKPRDRAATGSPRAEKPSRKTVAAPPPGPTTAKIPASDTAPRRHRPRFAAP
jgi:hypothetical protein